MLFAHIVGSEFDLNKIENKCNYLKSLKINIYTKRLSDFAELGR